LADLGEAADLSPDNLEIRVEFARALARKRRTAEAIQAIRPVLSARPDDGPANLLRGRLAARQDDVETAIQCFRRAIEAGAVTAEALRRDPAVRTIRDDPRFVRLLNSH
ncbi:MAG: tetratricopeptide repeat protein, partial [Phycisphaerae bacterium]